MRGKRGASRVCQVPACKGKSGQQHVWRLGPGGSWWWLSLKSISTCHRLGVVIEGSLCLPSVPRLHSVGTVGTVSLKPTQNGDMVPQKGLRSLGAAGGTQAQGWGYCSLAVRSAGPHSHPALPAAATGADPTAPLHGGLAGNGKRMSMAGAGLWSLGSPGCPRTAAGLLDRVGSCGHTCGGDRAM